MRTLTEFSTSVIAVTKMITCKFLRGVLLRMNGRSADGVFYLAILALLKIRQTLFFTSARQGYRLVSHLYKFY